MFYTHNLNNHTTSLKNLVLLFLTIVFGFGSVIVLAQLTIDTDITNAWQTIAKITITDNGQETTPRLEFSATGIFIDPTILTPYTTFSGKVLGLDDNGNLISTPSQGLVVSWGSAGGGGLRDAAGDDVYRYTGNVGIGTATMSGKLHLLGSWTTEVYIQETNPANAANINFQTTQQRWMLWGFNTKFYIWLSWESFLNITTGGFVGIWLETPSVPLQVVGKIIAGCSTNIITGTDSAIIGWGCGWEYGHQISGNNSFIAGGKGHTLEGDGSAIIWGATKNYLIRSNGAFMLGWWGNMLYDSNNATVAWGNINKIYWSTESFIAGWFSNTISWSSNSIIIWGNNTQIINATDSLSAWYKAINSWYNNTFVRNSSSTTGFYAGKAASFLINVPGGMGINTPNPQAALDVSGDIRSNSLQLSPSSINTWAGCLQTIWMIIYKGWHFYGCNWNRIQLDN